MKAVGNKTKGILQGFIKFMNTQVTKDKEEERPIKKLLNNI